MPMLEIRDGRRQDRPAGLVRLGCIPPRPTGPALPTPGVCAMAMADLPADDPLDAILNDPRAAERALQRQQEEALHEERRQELRAADALDEAWDWRYPQMYCPKLGRRLRHDELFAAWAERLKSWGNAVRACGPVALNALHAGRVPEGVARGSERERAATFARCIAVRAADPDCPAAAIESDLRRTCTEENANLLSELYLPSGWLRRIHDAIVRAAVGFPRQHPELEAQTAPAAPVVTAPHGGAAVPRTGRIEGAPRVVLGAPGERPLVLGREKRLLTLAQFDVVKALLDAGERGLSKDELDRQSKHGDARKTMKRLADSDPDWKAVLHFPGRTGGGYRIRNRPDAGTPRLDSLSAGWPSARPVRCGRSRARLEGARQAGGGVTPMSDMPSVAGLTVRDLARRFRVNPDKVRLWIRRGELRAVNTATARCGRPRWVGSPDALAEFERRRTSGPPPRPRAGEKRLRW